MFQLDLPNVYEVINNGKLRLEAETSKSVKSQGIVVVSVFGSTWNATLRGTQFKRAFQLSLDAFGSLSLFNKEVKKDSEEGDLSSLVGFFNEDESVLFLHIEGQAFDITSSVEAFQELRTAAKEPNVQSLLSIFSTCHTGFCRWLLLLFSLSHVMIMSETGCSFNTSYVSLFRALDCIRQDLLPAVARILSRIEGLPRQWIDHARLCSPRLLFLFEIESDNPTKTHNISTLTSCPVKERKEMLQNEIYQIFRKCRIITNISANSLFAIPSNDDFVYVFDKSAQNTFSTSQSLSYTYLDIFNTLVKKTNSKQATTSTSASRTSSSTSLPIKMSFRASQDTLTYNDSVTSFRNFLLEHITIAHDRGFEDDYRRVSGSKHFFVRPTLGQWEIAYNKLFQKLIVEPVSERIVEAYFQMEKLINVDSEYLEIQCAELFPKVYATYQRGLPEFYTAQQHQAKLAYAVNLFLNISRGSGVIPWLKKLAEKCEKYWKNGRQQCETLSLLGHVCANPIHRVKRQDHLEIIPLPEFREELPEMQHSSTSRIISHCNCGRRQGSREEPFTIRDANYDYYKKLAKECCDKLEAYFFTVFSSAEDSKSELSLQEMLVILQRKSISSSSTVAGGGVTMQERLEEDGVNQEENLESPELPEVFESELRQEDGIDEDESESEEESDDEDKIVEDDIESVISSKQDSGIGESSAEKSENSLTSTASKSLYKKTSSTVEYLPGMYHSKSPTGLLTLFPSWSLVCLGASSLYSHSHGVNQPGFVNGANALLPWDVKVKAEVGVTFVPPTRGFRGRRLKPKTSLFSELSNEFSVKVFFGYEYECRKGHRFFCDSNAVLYALNYNIATQKSIAGKVIANDMPLYVYCPCKENRDTKQIAQLIRIHVVTPKAPVFVTLNCKVQPGTTSPVFQTGEDPIKLPPSTYWIMRLPFSYVGQVVYVPPSDVTRYNGKVLKGTLNVVSMSPGETDEWERLNQGRL